MSREPEGDVRGAEAREPPEVLQEEAPEEEEEVYEAGQGPDLWEGT